MLSELYNRKTLEGSTACCSVKITENQWITKEGKKIVKFM